MVFSNTGDRVLLNVRSFENRYTRTISSCVSKGIFLMDVVHEKYCKQQTTIVVYKFPNEKFVKGIRWMPRLQKAMKDVAGDDTLRGGAEQPLIRRFPNGETPSIRMIVD